MNIIEIIILCILVFICLSYAFISVSVLLGASFGAPFVPSSKKSIKKMIELADVKPSDMVFDLGCGDGRIVFALEKLGVRRSIGVEISPMVYLFAVIRKKIVGAKRSEIRMGNIFSQPDFAEANVIFAFLMPNIMQKIFAEIWPQLKPGARIVSSSFFPKNVEADVVIPREKGQNKICVYVKK